MVNNKAALGRGLAALIGESKLARGELAMSDHAAEGRLRELRLDEIMVNRRQPRRTFDVTELQELADSIGHLGVVQPIVVRRAAAADVPTAGEAAAVADDKKYELIAGERRLRAAGMAGMETIPALVRSADEVASLEIALAENVAREDLNGIEEAHAYAALVDQFGLTHERIGELVGRSRAAVSNILRLLELPDDVQSLVETGQLSEGHARALLGLASQDERRRVARLVIKQGLAVRQTEDLVRRLAAAGTAPAAPKATDPALDDLNDELYGLLAAPVRIKAGARGGKLEISFKDRRDLERLVTLLRTIGGA